MGIFFSILLLLIVGVLYLVPGKFSDDNYLIESRFIVGGPCQIQVNGVQVSDEQNVTDIFKLSDDDILLDCIYPSTQDLKSPLKVSGGFVMPKPINRLPASSDELSDDEDKIYGSVLHVPFVQEAPDQHTDIMLVVNNAKYRSFSERNNDGTYAHIIVIIGNAVRKYGPP